MPPFASIFLGKKCILPQSKISTRIQQRKSKSLPPEPKYSVKEEKGCKF
jgi:hypothetical protein